MNTKHLSIFATLPAALLFACAASAQQTPPQQQPTQPPMTQPQQQPQQQQPPMQNQQNNMNNRGMNNNRTPSFSSLAGSKGYITRSEASQVPWLAEHFKKCDRNDNGKISHSEFNMCRQKYGNQSH